MWGVHRQFVIRLCAFQLARRICVGLLCGYGALFPDHRNNMVSYRGGEEVPRQEDSTDQRCVHVIGLYYLSLAKVKDIPR